MKRFSMTSCLLPVEERLRAVVHWEESLRATRGPDFAYRLNAYLCATRSVTFLLQGSSRTYRCSFRGGRDVRPP